MSEAVDRVGSNYPHESAMGHVTGTARYIDDLPLPADTLHIATAYAAETCGNVLSVDVSKASVMPGVVDILTWQDVPGDNDIGPVFEGDKLLAQGAVVFHGQPVVAVAARSFRQAQQAAGCVEIQVAPSSSIQTIAGAIEADSTLLPARDWGNPDTVVGGAHTIEGVLEIGGQEHFYLESQAALAIPDDDGGILIHSSTQHPDDVQHLVAKVLDLPLHMITVQCQRMGGGFGGKETQAAPLACMTALFAKRNRCAVKYRMPRRDDMIQTGKRHPMQWCYKLSCDKAGVLKQGDIRLEANCGHSPDLSSGIVDRALYHATNCYAFESVRLRAEHRRLNQVSHTAFRGFGGPQGMLGMEAAMDEIAYALAQDPLDVRLKNLYRPGADRTPYGQQVEGFLLPDIMHTLADQCDYRSRQIAVDEFNHAHTYLRKGLALTPVQFGISFTTTHLNQAAAVVLIYRDGTIQVNHGGTEMGQGLHTKIKQVVAQAFGLPLSAIRHTATRTDKVPNASATAASSGSDLNGMAALDACQQLQHRLTQFAQAQLGAPENIQFANGALTGAGFSISFVELVQAAYLGRVSLLANGFYATPDIHFDKEKGWGKPFYYFAYGAAASEVVIDIRTGAYRFLRTDILHDVGASLNPAIDIGQIEGGFIQGLGWLTSEELSWDDAGRITSNSPANYKIPTSDMCPDEFNVRLFDRPNHAQTIHRSKAVGEPPLMLAISAWSALRQAAAWGGNRFPRLSVPATPEAVYWAVQEARR
ncbi:MAG: xanthine dehydrogenase molybdopterin binding subunit [Pseudomonadota bacterium]